MTPAQYHQVIAEFKGMELPHWTRLGRLEKLRLKRNSTDWLRKRISVALLSGGSSWPLWPNFTPDVVF